MERASSPDRGQAPEQVDGPELRRADRPEVRRADVRVVRQQTAGTTDHVRYLQRRAGWAHVSERQQLEHQHVRRVQVLALVTLVLWLAALLLMLSTV